MGADNHTDKYLGRQQPDTIPLLQSTPLPSHTNASNGYQSTEPTTGENIAPHHHSTTHHDHHPLPLPSHYYQALQTTSNRYMWLALACLMYCAINVALFLVNYVNHSLISDDEDPVVSEQVYHLTEFWNTFAFAVIESISLVLQTTTNHHHHHRHSQQSQQQQQQPIISPRLLKGLVITNIIAALVPALLMTMDMEYFEIPCHEAEYVNEIIMSAVDFLMLGGLYKNNHHNNSSHSHTHNTSTDDTAVVVVNNTKPRFWAIVAGVIGTLQLFLYNGLGRTPDGDMKGEVLAHYCEFAFGCLSGLITFWLCMDNKATADHHILLQSTTTTAPRRRQHSNIRVLLSPHHPCTTRQEES